MTKISQYSALPGDLANGDLFDLSEDQGGGAFASKSVSYLQLKTNLNSDLSFSNTIYTADGVLAGNRIIDGGAPTPDLSFTNLGSFSVAATSSIAFNTDKLYIDIATGYVGIGTITPSIDLEIAGQVKITGGTPGASKVLTSDANGLATWATPTTGTVTSIATAGTVNGVTLTGGPITTTGTITLGGTLAINNGDWSGTDLAIANGGTGASTAQAAIDSLTAVSGASTSDVLTKDGSGNATWAAPSSGSTLYSADSTLAGARNVNMNSLALGFTNASAGVAIGTATADASAVLDVSSTTEGFLPPRMTTVQMNAIGSPATGLLVYDTTTNQWMGYNGTSWVILG